MAGVETKDGEAVRSPKRELTLAIQQAGSIKAAAKGMGVAPSTVSRWRKKGVPKNQRDRLAFFRQAQKEARAAEKKDTSARDLRRMLKRAGSIKELARQLGYSPGTVGRWLRKGIPKTGTARQMIAMVREQRAEKRVERAKETKRLKQLRRMAEKKMRAEGRPFAPVKTFEKPMDGARAVGLQWQWAIQRELTEETINDIEAWARKHKKRYPLWQMNFRLAMYAPGSGGADFVFPKSGAPIAVMVDAPDKRDFIAEHSMSGPRNRNLNVVITYLREQLQQMVLGSGTVFVLTVGLWNYRLRTEEERKQRERDYRKQQAKKSKAKKKAKKKGRK